MPRSVWKGPYVAVNLLQEVVALARKHPEWWSKGRFQGQKAPEVINTFSRASVILPDFIACRFGVHNGRSFVNMEVQEAMVGHRLGEFSATRVMPKHKVKDSGAVPKKKINAKTGKAA
ncbi:30S ribosomal protein S19 [Tetrabaena socialis]|uniref:Small ribosomal subunit protein uS19c n=1 Tax=Tetrabaena socialis TaxID=47790 RepID=A0A2J8A213_9CHLO|nr:30S ribosomal protein S19 [Tetrabaena socialis]|eukprot:PNH06557.1 30S ribosomal protein S19 [Tetrabaena socialis]